MGSLSVSRIFILSLSVIFLIACEKEPSHIESSIDFEIILTDTIAPASISFINKSENLKFFEWSFGDDSFSNEISPEHLFKNEGDYTVTLRGWNDDKEISLEKSFHLSKVFQFIIINESSFVLYDLTSYSGESSREDDRPVCHGQLDASESSEKCATVNHTLYISFENAEGIRLRTAFPCNLEEDILNELIIDKFTLVIIDCQAF